MQMAKRWFNCEFYNHATCALISVLHIIYDLEAVVLDGIGLLVMGLQKTLQT